VGCHLAAQDFLDELPAARGEVMKELYGAEYMEALARSATRGDNA
jgi:hypothetical protein